MLCRNTGIVKKKVNMYLCICMAVFLQTIKAEIFTSMADMEKMVLSEKKMVEELRNYLHSEEIKLKDIKKFLARVDDNLHLVNESDVGKYLGNPVNSYLMLKRFNVDWKQLEKTLEVDLAERFNAVYQQMRPNFPSSEDHLGAMDALFRLQKTYKLRSISLARGIIPGVQGISIQPLSIQEMYDIGYHAYQRMNWPYTIEWFRVALQEMGDAREMNGIERDSILDYLAYALFKEGEFAEAYKLTQELILYRPDDKRIQENMAYFKSEVHNLERYKRGDLGEKPAEEFTRAPDTEVEKRKKILHSYEKLCRGEVRPITRKEERHMKCWYRQKGAVLRYKPQKVERLWVNPEILEFHQILTEPEIEWIKKTAYPMLERATIQDPATGKLTTAHYRVSKSAWLDPREHLILRRLQKRAEAATGLDIDYAESLQIANYGIGGHYEPHFDHARETEDKFSDLGMGNRIATLLVYSSDVKAGGPTVFTSAQTAVWPRKGSAVFWYNLKRNGRGNPMTRHAACPVLVGQKWVSNWWIHEYGQVFRRPCALNKDW